jgi:hypothetical protein
MGVIIDDGSHAALSGHILTIPPTPRNVAHLVYKLSEKIARIDSPMASPPSSQGDTTDDLVERFADRLLALHVEGNHAAAFVGIEAACEPWQGPSDEADMLGFGLLVYYSNVMQALINSVEH